LLSSILSELERSSIGKSLFLDLEKLWVEHGVQRLGILDQPTSVAWLREQFLHDPTLINQYDEATSGVARWEVVRRSRVATRTFLLLLSAPIVDLHPLRLNNPFIKAPFSIHGSTDKIACPISKEEMLHFDPVSAPSLTALLAPDNNFALNRFRAAVEVLRGWIVRSEYSL
jgi:hypothetical protein